MQSLEQRSAELTSIDLPFIATPVHARPIERRLVHGPQAQGLEKFLWQTSWIFDDLSMLLWCRFAKDLFSTTGRSLGN